MISSRFFFLVALLGTTTAVASPQRYTQKIEVIDIPASVSAGGSGMIYVDSELMPKAPARDELIDQLSADAVGSAVDLLQATHPIYTDLRRALMRYRQKWSHLPQEEIAPGSSLKSGQQGKRVQALRRRLGLSNSTRFDAALAAAVLEYEKAHGLKTDGVADAETIASLNLGAQHYERLLMINLERARSLPVRPDGRYILVDAGAARIWLYENGQPKESMKAIVGTQVQETPVMAALLRFAEVNPYWNVPPDLVQNRIAPRVLSEGPSYITSRRYEILSDWTEAATVVDPKTVNWAAVAEGREELRVRQLPGGANSMGRIKFMMPNDFGIYLHDTPDKSLFEKSDRWLSNGCVRVEDAQRLAEWLFGEMPQAQSPDREERVELAEPVPVYITYMTAGLEKDGSVAFRADPYKRDGRLMARLFGEPEPVETALR